MLLGAQFPMLDLPKRPESLSNLEGSLKDEAYVTSLSHDLQQTIASFKESVKRTRSLPKSRIELLQALEESIGLTGACLSSYISFKSEAL